MRRRHLFIALATPILVIGCSPPAVQTPPVGALTADAAFPPIGAKWKIRVTEGTGVPEDQEVTAIAVDFNGHPAYGLANSTTTVTNIFNPTTFSGLGSIKGGKIITTATPESPLFSWPLFVGKSWDTSYSFSDIEHGRTFSYIAPHRKVAAYEDVTVPAGTFKAFRIEQTPGPNVVTNTTYWYSPSAKMVVKLVSERPSSYYLGAGSTTTELLTTPK